MTENNNNLGQCQGKSKHEETTAVRGFHSTHYSECNRPAKVARTITVGWGAEAKQVVKNFCGVHDPEAKKARAEAREQERRDRYALENRARDAKYRRDSLKDELCRKLTDAQIAWLTQRLAEDKDLQADLAEVK